MAIKTSAPKMNQRRRRRTELSSVLALGDAAASLSSSSRHGISMRPSGSGVHRVRVSTGACKAWAATHFQSLSVRFATRICPQRRSLAARKPPPAQASPWRGLGSQAKHAPLRPAQAWNYACLSMPSWASRACCRSATAAPPGARTILASTKAGDPAEKLATARERQRCQRVAGCFQRSGRAARAAPTPEAPRKAEAARRTRDAWFLSSAERHGARRGARLPRKPCCG